MFSFFVEKRKIKVSLFLVIFFPLFFKTVAIAEEPEKAGGLSISLEKRIFEPFEISSYKVILDGRVVLRNIIGDKDLNSVVIDKIQAGTHKVFVKAVYSGSGYGIFDYHENYKYPVRSETDIKIKEGLITKLKVVFNDNDGFLRELEKRPFISYETDQTRMIVSEGEKEPFYTEVKEDFEKPGVKAKSIKKVFVEKGKKQIKVHIVGDGYFKDVKTSRIDKPERVVIDLPGIKELLDVDKVVVKSPFLDRIRVGQHPYMSRVVLDIPSKKRVDYEVNESNNGLTVTVFDSHTKPEGVVKKEAPQKYIWNLSDVFVEKKDHAVEILLAGNGNLGKYEGRRIAGPERILLDIQGAKKVVQNDVLTVNSELLKAVRIGQHPGGVRLVLDIPEGADVDYNIGEAPGGLSVKLSAGEIKTRRGETSDKTGSFTGRLREISVESGSVEVEISMHGSGPFEKYDVKKFFNPDRLVIDLPGIKEDLINNKIAVDSALVKAVRVGQEANIARVVVDLEGGSNLAHQVVPSDEGLIVSVYLKD